MDVTNLKEYVYNWNTSCDVSQWRSITPKQDSWMFLQMAREAHLIATLMGSTIKHDETPLDVWTALYSNNAK